MWRWHVLLETHTPSPHFLELYLYSGERMKNKTYKKWIEIAKSQKNKCFYCGIKLVVDESWPRCGVDHILPKSTGNSHEENNLVVACDSCNSVKGALSPIDFLSSLEIKIKKYPHNLRWKRMRRKFSKVLFERGLL